ncbi:MAG TPA: SDR family NAD(P)-dependent oxidoreductase [Burkholderiaceae bacterium]|nr:SDR family NAD(P)-dependent oxidoreductase [Burkholderiaceae bacterium]
MGAMQRGLEGRLAWVTGGGTGIGRATAAWLGRAGATVAISGRRVGELEDAAAALRAEGLRVEVAPADVSDAASVAAAHATLSGRHGPVSVLVCAAGTNVPDRHWSTLSPEGFSKVVQINLVGVANAVHAVLPGMRAAGTGSICVVSSFAGWAYKDFPGPAYSASKAALDPLVQSLNDEQGRHGIRACHFCPGEVSTPILMTRPVPPSTEELARMLRPEDVADAIGYVVTAPPHVCLAEVVIAPTWNRFYIGGEDLKRRA